MPSAAEPLRIALEDNMAMRNILAALGSIPYKRYRIYERML
jgi:hypothetical protein